MRNITNFFIWSIILNFIPKVMAFAPTRRSSSPSALYINELELGVTEPLGFFDPLGYLEKNPLRFERIRAVERKHGRVAMVAMVGTIVHNNLIVFDGYLSPSENLKFRDISEGYRGILQVPVAGILQIIAFIGLIEVGWWPASKYDGDYGIGYFGNDILDPVLKARKLNIELNNGRAAMMGIVGNIAGEIATGQTMYEQYATYHYFPFGDGQGLF